MGNIIQLNEKLSNMIAAGEVVENMASVVKELVENAIDAKSTTIQIHLKEYGLKEIRIIDNGVGMDKDDLSMAFKRHATSKIKTEHDLFHIASLGFRGEALPSIASVSELDIESSQNNDAHKLTLKNGEVIDSQPGTIQQGTAITVKNLFYNTPARLKHLKSETRELSFIIDYINKLALSHPDIRFQLTHNKKTLLSTTGENNLLKILHQIYDQDIVKNLLPFEASNAYFSIKGYACKPSYTRSSRQHITLITNGRMIKNNRIIHAVLEGYRTYLPVQKYPIVILNITVDPLLIDINIHPQKLDIKFTEERSLITLISKTMENTLRNASLIPTIKQEKPVQTQNTKLEFDYEQPTKEDVTYQENPTSEDAFLHTIEEPSNEATEEMPKVNKHLPDLDYIGQYRGTYLLFQNDDGLYLIDQHAAAERIRYELYVKSMSTNREGQKPLLLPITIHLDNKERAQINAIKPVLKDFGLEVSITDEAIKLTQVPTWFYDGDEDAYAEIIIKKTLDEDSINRANLIDQLAKDLACKHSIKANKYITKEEVFKLYQDLNKCQNPYTCPHGRPTIIHFKPTDIERMFKRIQS